MTKIATHPNRKFLLVTYDKNWPKLFDEKSKIISNILGKNICSIEHIGSTSVPGMVAKPQIDMVATVKKISELPNYYSQMQLAGFTPRGDYTGEGEEYFTEDLSDGRRLTSVHILPKGHVWFADLVNFRDYLRANPNEVMRYSKAKQEAVSKYPDDYDKYYKSKLELVQDLRQKAAQWRSNKPQ